MRLNTGQSAKDGCHFLLCRNHYEELDIELVNQTTTQAAIYMTLQFSIKNSVVHIKAEIISAYSSLPATINLQRPGLLDDLV